MKIAPSLEALGPSFQPAQKHSFLPIIDRPLDNTAMTAYKTCPREYHFSMIQHRRADGRTPALVFGTCWHKIMETHYKTGGNRDKVIYAATLAWEGHNVPDDYRTLDRCLADYDQYVDEFGLPGGPRDSGLTLGYPDAPLVEVATNASGMGILHPWAGKLDRFIDLGSLIYVEDHKTTSRLDKNYFKQYSVSNQMKGYQFLGQQILPSRLVVGVRMNVAHVLTKTTKFLRECKSFSKPIIDEWVRNENVWMKRLARDYELLAEGDPDAFPGHYGDNGCSRKFGMCGYYEVCNLTPAIRQQVLERDYPVNIWNPLEGDKADD